MFSRVKQNHTFLSPKIAAFMLCYTQDDANADGGMYYAMNSLFYPKTEIVFFFLFQLFFLIFVFFFQKVQLILYKNESLTNRCYNTQLTYTHHILSFDSVVYVILSLSVSVSLFSCNALLSNINSFYFSYLFVPT